MPRRAGDAARRAARTELALLEREFAASAEARCRLVTVVGEAGRRQVAAHRRARRARSGTAPGSSAARASRTARASPTGRSRRSSRELTGIRDEHSAEQARASSTVSSRDRRDAGGRRRSSPSWSGWRRRTLRRGACVGFGASSRPRPTQPLVVLVDDIHWAEPTLLDLLARLPAADRGSRPRALPRPARAARRPARLAGHGEARAARRRRGRRAARGSRARPAGAASGSRSSRRQPAVRRGARAWAREGGDLDDRSRPASTRSSARGSTGSTPASATRSSAAPSRARSSTRAPSIELSDVESRPAVPGRARRALPQGPDPHRGRRPRRRRESRIASSTSSSATPPTAPPRRGSARRCTSASPTGSSELAGERVGEYEEILGYHLEQAYRYRAELGLVDATNRALGERAAGHLGRGTPRPGTKRPPRRR